MPLTELAHVAAAIWSPTEPSPEFLWAHQYDYPANPNKVNFKYHDGTQWRTLQSSRYYQDPVIDQLSTPPGTPNDGDRYLIGASPTGAWSGHAQDIATYANSAWEFYTPDEGDIAYHKETTNLFRFNGSTWQDLLGTTSTYFNIKDLSHTLNQDDFKSAVNFIDSADVQAGFIGFVTGDGDNNMRVISKTSGSLILGAAATDYLEISSTGQVLIYNGPLITGYGNASAPVITNSGDPGTGIYYTLPFAGALHIAVDGDQAAQYNSSDIIFFEDDGSTPFAQFERDTGQVTFHEYGSGSITGTPTYALAVDASGNLVEIAVGGGGWRTTAGTTSLGSGVINIESPNTVDTILQIINREVSPGTFVSSIHQEKDSISLQVADETGDYLTGKLFVQNTTVQIQLTDFAGTSNYVNATQYAADIYVSSGTASYNAITLTSHDGTEGGDERLIRLWDYIDLEYYLNSGANSYKQQFNDNGIFFLTDDDNALSIDTTDIIFYEDDGTTEMARFERDTGNIYLVHQAISSIIVGNNWTGTTLEIKGRIEASTSNAYYTVKSTGGQLAANNTFVTILSKNRLSSKSGTLKIDAVDGSILIDTTDAAGVLYLRNQNVNAQVINATDIILYEDNGTSVLAQFERDTSTIYLGNSNSPSVFLNNQYGSLEFTNALVITYEDASTTGILPAHLLIHESTLTPDVGYGVGTVHYLENDNETVINAGRFGARWVDPTDGAEYSEYAFIGIENGSEETLFATIGAAGITLIDRNIVLGTTTGTKIGTTTSQKIGLYGVTPVVQPAALTAPDTSTVDATYGTEEAAVINNLRTRLNELESRLQSLGAIA